MKNLLIVFIITIVLTLTTGVNTTHSHNTETRDGHNHETREHNAKGYDDDSSHHNGMQSKDMVLMIVLPAVLVIALVVVIIVIVYIVYRTHFSHGSLCCFKPKRHVLRFEPDDERSLEESRSPSPPTYPGMSSISPPDYSDAVSDAILLRGIDTTTVSLPPYENHQSTASNNNSDNSHMADLQSQTNVHVGHVRQNSKDTLDNSSESDSAEQRLITS